MRIAVQETCIPRAGSYVLRARQKPAIAPFTLNCPHRRSRITGWFIRYILRERSTGKNPDKIIIAMPLASSRLGLAALERVE